MSTATEMYVTAQRVAADPGPDTPPTRPAIAVSRHAPTTPARCAARYRQLTGCATAEAAETFGVSVSAVSKQAQRMRLEAVARSGVGAAGRAQ